MTREEIIQAISDDKAMPYIQPGQLVEIVDFVIKNYRPSPPYNLDEVADHYEQTKATELACKYGWSEADIRKQCFITGAEWMVGQGETLEGDVEGDWRNQEDAPYQIYVTSDCLPEDTEFKFGDKVVVQIRKK